MSVRRVVEGVGLRVLAGALLVFLAAPFVALALRTPPEELVAGIRHPLVLPALRLSIATTFLSTSVVIVFGTPLAWVLSQGKGRVARAIETLVTLPIVVPPAVAGLALLLAFGSRGLFSGLLCPAGSSVALTTAAVVIAQVFVSAPYYLQPATAAFRAIDPAYLLVARCFGASPLRVLMRIALPLALPGIAGGAATSWARALGEFGATLMFAGSLEGRTQTLPLAVYAALETDLRAAQAISIVLVVLAFGVLIGVGAVTRRLTGGS